MIEKRCRRKKHSRKFILGIVIGLLLMQIVFPVAAFAGVRFLTTAPETTQNPPVVEEAPSFPATSSDAVVPQEAPSPAPQETLLPEESVVPEVSATAEENMIPQPIASEAPIPEESAAPQPSLQAMQVMEAVAEAVPVPLASQPCNFLSRINLTHIEPKNPPYPRNATVRLEYGYRIPAGITLNTEYTFNIPDVFLFTQDFVIDVKMGDKKVGKAQVRSVDNAVALSFFEPEAVITGSTGEIWVTAQFDPGKIDNAGLQPVVFKDGGNNEIGTANVPFLIDQIEGGVPVTEEGAVDLANMRLNWEATLAPTLENVAAADQNKPEGKIGSLVFSTVIGDGQTFDASMLADCSAAIQGGSAVSGAVFSYDAASKTLTCTFANPVENGDKIVVSFPTKLTVGSFGGANSKDFHNAVKVGYAIPQYDVTGPTAVLTTPKADNKTADKKVNAQMEMLGKDSSLSGREITWTVKINQSKLPVVDAVITDTLPAGLRIIGTPVLKDADGNNVTTASVIVDTPTESLFTVDSLSKITVDFGAAPMGKACILTYTTKIHDDFYKENKVGPFKNHVAFTGTVGGEGISYEKDASQSVATALIAKSGTYNTQDHTITWNIDFNSNLTGMLGAQMTDVIPQGLTLDPASVTIGGNPPATGAISYDANSRTLTVRPGDLNQTAQQVVYRTTVDDNAIWANNYEKGKPFNNIAKLEAEVDGRDVSVQSAYQPDIVSKVISCEAVQNDYNYADKLAKWRLTVNQNQMEVTNGTAEVEIPQGQEFNTFCAALPPGYSYTVTTPVSGPSRLKIILPPLIAKGSAPVVIEYWTKITNLEEFNENPKVNISNAATLISGETPVGGVRTAADQAVANSVVKKSGEVKSGATNVITWKVLVNENLIPMKSPTLRDPLMEGLVLEPSSVTLYKLGVQGGKVDENQREAVSLADGAIEYDSATRLFLFHFEADISDAYLLVFDTHIDCDKAGVGNKRFTNSVSLTGGDVQQQGSPAELNAFVFDDGGIANKFSGSVKILKKDEVGNPLQGAKFKLNNVLKTTDENGVALFDQLLPGTYTGKEVSAPEHCIAAPADTPDALKNIVITTGVTTPVEIEIENTRIKSALEITKTDENGTPIQGVVFRVKNEAGTPAYEQSATTDENGNARFNDLLYGGYTYEETDAPEQYVIDRTPVSFAVTRENHGTVIQRTVTNEHKAKPSPEQPSPRPSNPPQDAPSNPSADGTGGTGASADGTSASAPRTGDVRDAAPFLFLAGLSAAGLIAGIALRGRQKERKNRA